MQIIIQDISHVVDLSHRHCHLFLGILDTVHACETGTYLRVPYHLDLTYVQPLA